MSNKLDKEKFLAVIEATPLVSIDLVVEDRQGRILVGQRMNRPAQGCWFVPGGRIQKNELLADAVLRISTTELGMALSINQAKYLGAFDHIYADNFAAQEGISTHYVALGYHIHIGDNFKIRSDDQHAAMQWLTRKQLLDQVDVHENTKQYFYT